MSGTEELAQVGASPARRFIAIGTLWFLGALLIYAGVSAPPAPAWGIVLPLMGAGALWLGSAMLRATSQSILLTPSGLVDSAGTVLAPIEQIVRVDRSAFALKPSNGFTLTLRESQPRGWRPGLWWRMGRKLGIGGVAPGAQTRLMADRIATLLSERDAG